MFEGQAWTTTNKYSQTCDDFTNLIANFEEKLAPLTQTVCIQGSCLQIQFSYTGDYPPYVYRLGCRFNSARKTRPKPKQFFDKPRKTKKKKQQNSLGWFCLGLFLLPRFFLKRGTELCEAVMYKELTDWLICNFGFFGRSFREIFWRPFKWIN